MSAPQPTPTLAQPIAATAWNAKRASLRPEKKSICLEIRAIRVRRKLAPPNRRRANQVSGQNGSIPSDVIAFARF
jgi:hypothetical protein